MSDTAKRVFLGAVADDVTGASDLAINLVKGGLRVVQFLRIPSADELDGLECDAVVVALKTRSIGAQEAIDQSIAAISALKEHGCQRFFFKYCSTFDSTCEGNIGPVSEALMELLNVDRTILCPAFPEAGRTVYQGHLFVGDRLLNESGMQHHPLNPMTDADLVRWAQTQCRQKVGRVSLPTIHQGSGAVSSAIDEHAQQQTPLVVTDCCENDDLKIIAEAVGDFPLVTGGSGIGRFLPAAWRSGKLIASTPHTATLPCIGGKSVIIAGSCSTATQGQVAFMRERCVSVKVDVAALMEDADQQMATINRLAQSVTEEKPLLIYSSAGPDEIDRLHQTVGQAQISQAVEQFHARVAAAMVERHGFRRLIVAGGETSGAVVEALGISKLTIGPEICTGVPWTQSSGGQDQVELAIALKSGNFGDVDFFQTALAMLDEFSNFNN